MTQGPPTRITPFLIGHGRSGQAVTDALALLKSRSPQFDLQAPVWLARGDSFKPASEGKSVAFICNPHGLHSERILEAAKAGFHGIASEKPACVNLSQAFLLESVNVPCAVFHVYRQMWGPQTLKKMLVDGRFGDLISLEGRYWQASTAERALKGPATNSWKNNVSLSGPSDTLLDVGTHWVDLAIFLAGEMPSKIGGWASYANAESPHRDSHVHLNMEFTKDLRAMASISKTMHGATNHFEINVIGTKASATWTFLNPDEILLGEGRVRRVMIRDTDQLGTGHPSFHATGWLEGYTEITRELLNEVAGDVVPVPSDAPKSYPNLRDSIHLVRALLESSILK